MDKKTDDYLRDFGNRMREARLVKGISQRELAETIDAAVGSIPGYENGQINPSMTVAKDIASALDVSLTWLVTGGDVIELGADHDRAQKIREYVRFLDHQNTP